MTPVLQIVIVDGWQAWFNHPLEQSGPRTKIAARVHKWEQPKPQMAAQSLFFLKHNLRG